jgi:2-dehydropantoate 2-reductase
MRFVVFGAGAIGGVVGGRMFENGHDVALIARGAHYEAMRDGGLRIDSRAGSVTVQPAVFDDAAKVDWRDDDAVLLCVKSQHTQEALEALDAAAPTHVPIVSLQNGVCNEPAALRYFANVYGVCVMCPAVHLEPGVVDAGSTPISGMLDVGRFPDGTDAVADELSRAFGSSTFDSFARSDIMRWKYGKLLNNLSNAIDALCGRAKGNGRIIARARAEAVTVLDAAGIAFVDHEEDSARRGDILQFEPGGGRLRPGSSSWQSLARGAGSIEADYLNGEIVWLGRQVGVPTPINETLRRLANQAAHEHRPPGSMTPDELAAELPAVS